MRAKRFFITIGAFIALVAFLVYLPTLWSGFVSFDDPVYVYQNENLSLPFGELIRWAFTSVVAANWHPLTLLSHAVDLRIFGLNPMGHHLVNNLLHAINTFLVFLVVLGLLRVSGTGGEKDHSLNSGSELGDKEGKGPSWTLWVSGTTALIFALHPLHVESVAWVSERKDLLSALFFLLAILTYLGYAASDWQRERGVKVVGARFYALSLFFFILALLSKPMAVSLPVVLVIIDIFVLKRFDSVRRMVVDKAPYFFLSLALGIITIWAQSSGGAVRGEGFSIATRVVVAARAYLFYLYKTFLPVGLTPFYPYPEGAGLASAEYVLFVLIFIAICGLAVYLLRRSKIYLALWCYFVVTLLPVVGLVQVGSQGAADRYMYLPSIAPVLLVGLFAGAVYERVRMRKLRKEFLILGVVIAIALGALTILQTRVWKDSITLWTTVIDRYPTAVAGPYYNRGRDYMEMERYEMAVADFTSALKIDPSERGSLNNRGISYRKTGRFALAIADFDRAIELAPGDPMTYNNRGVAYGSLGEMRRAIEDFERAASLDPYFMSAYRNLSRAYSELGDKERAAYYMQKARGGL